MILASKCLSSRLNLSYLVLSPFIVVYSVEPSMGSVAGGLLVTVTGNFFDDDTVVLIGGKSFSYGHFRL